MSQQPPELHNAASHSTAAPIPYKTAAIDDLVRQIQKDRISPTEFSCGICGKYYLMNCQKKCTFRATHSNPVWHFPDGTSRPYKEAEYCVKEHVAWRQFNDMFSLRRNADSRTESVLTMLVGPAVPARCYPRLLKDSELFIIIFLKRMLDTAPTESRQQQRVVEVLCQRILEIYSRDHSGKELMRTPHFEGWLDELRGKCNTVYGQSARRRDNVPEAARLGGAAGSGGAGTSTAAAAAQNVTDDFISDEFIMTRIFGLRPIR